MVLLELSRQLQCAQTLLSDKHWAVIPYPLTFGQGMYVLPTSQCVDYSDKELNEYNFDLYIARPWMVPYGKLKNMVKIEYTHFHNLEDFWSNYKDDKEVRMRNYMHMMTFFVRMVNFF